MRNLLIFFSLFLTSTVSQASTFAPFQELLDKYLKSETIANGGLQTSFDYNKAYNDSSTPTLLKKQKDILNKIDLKSLDTKNKANAFWINTYNFYMIEVILTRGFNDQGKLKINSVKDFGSWFNPYKIFKQEVHNIGGKNYSLDQMEKSILLGETYKKKGWKDARIHFAVNCASVGCPPLIKQVYTAESLDKTLDENIKKALKTPRHFNIKGKTLYLTHLFKWYKNDFVEHSGSVEKFLGSFLSDPKTKESLEAAKGTEFIEYNWSLNRPENF